jgi:hypothetical protein
MAIALPPSRPIELVAISVEAPSAARTTSPPTSGVASADALDVILSGTLGTNGTYSSSSG